MDEIELVPLPEAMRTLGVSRSKLYELLPSLDARKIGSKTVVTRASLKAFVAALPRFKNERAEAAAQAPAAA